MTMPGRKARSRLLCRSWNPGLRSETWSPPHRFVVPTHPAKNAVWMGHTQLWRTPEIWATRRRKVVAMNRVRNYFFGPLRDRSGTVLLLSRFDLCVTVVVAFTLLAAISYSGDASKGWTGLRIAIVAAIFIFSGVITQRPKIVFGCAFSFAAIRGFLGLLMGTHPLVFLAIAAICSGVAWLLLKEAVGQSLNPK